MYFIINYIEIIEVVGLIWGSKCVSLIMDTKYAQIHCSTTLIVVKMYRSKIVSICK